MIILEGTREERTNEKARAGIPMNAAETRWCIDQIERYTKQKNARIAVAKGAIRYGKISPEGKAVYQEYLKLLGS